MPWLSILKLHPCFSLRRQHTLTLMVMGRGLATADPKGLQQAPSCPRLAAELHGTHWGCRQVPDSEQGLSDSISKLPTVFL